MLSSVYDKSHKLKRRKGKGRTFFGIYFLAYAIPVLEFMENISKYIIDRDNHLLIKIHV